MPTKTKARPIKSWTFLGSTRGYSGKSKKYIYTVTSIDQYSYDDKLKPKSRRSHNSRCWGWYPTLKEAQFAVKNNSGDMAECCYYTHLNGPII